MGKQEWEEFHKIALTFLTIILVIVLSVFIYVLVYPERIKNESIFCGNYHGHHIACDGDDEIDYYTSLVEYSKL